MVVEAACAEPRADAELARAAVSGDTHAFEALYRRHVGRVHGAILRLTGGRHARAEELTQDAFVRAWQKLPGFRHQSAFGTWLYRLAVNTALMDLRASKNDPVEHSVDEEALAGYGAHSFCPAEAKELERAVTALSPRARAVLVLHDVEGWKHEEIAAELGMAIGSSKAQLHRARRLLRRALEERGEDHAVA
ncbi:MAG: sigma-70 family RNA polymerase sigma factor [Pseudomonadota bacterium]|nr:sigma-70 family RNA polymerase sigma factor [Pseudomonadota bacterium]